MWYEVESVTWEEEAWIESSFPMRARHVMHRAKVLRELSLSVNSILRYDLALWTNTEWREEEEEEEGGNCNYALGYQIWFDINRPLFSFNFFFFIYIREYLSNNCIFLRVF